MLVSVADIPSIQSVEERLVVPSPLRTSPLPPSRVLTNEFAGIYGRDISSAPIMGREDHVLWRGDADGL